MAKNRRGQIDIPLITPVEDDIKEETESEAYEDEVPIDIDLFCSNEAPQNSKSVQDDPLELTVPQGSFKGKREFTLEMQKEVGLMVQECVHVLKKDPRECHLFYVTIQKWVEIGLKLSHIPEEKASIVWEKCDSFALSELEKYKKKQTLLRKPHRHNPQKKACSSKTSQVELVEAAWKKMLSSTTFSKHSLYSLETRLLFFQCAKTLTSAQECSEMNFLWDCLLSSKLQSAPALKSPDVSGSKDKLSKSVHTMAKNLPELKIIIKKCTPGEKPETDEGQKKLHKSEVNFAPGSLLLSLKQSSRIPELRDAELHKLSRQEQINDQQQANAERDRLRRLTFTAEQKKAKAEKERLRRLNFTTEEKKARIERERLRRLNFTAEQKKANAEKQRLRRLNFTAEEKKANAEKKRLRRLNFTAEEKKAKLTSGQRRMTPEGKKARAERDHLRRKKQTNEQRKAHAERERLRRLNFTPEQREAVVRKARQRRAAMRTAGKNVVSIKNRSLDFQPAPELTFPGVPVSKDSPSKAVHKSSEQREAEEKLNRESDAARRAERKNAAVLKSRTSPEKETVNADFEKRTERGDAETGEERDAYQTKEQKQAKVERDRLRLRYLKLKEVKKFAFVKAKRKLTMEQMKAYYEERKERRDAKTGVQKDAYLKNKSFRKERSQKEQEAYQSSSENELFSEVELETEEEGLTVQENFVFKSKLEFESEMEKVMTTIIKESVAVLGMDPREYHPFYVKLHLFIQAGLQHNFIDVSEVSSIWEKWDSNGVSQFSNNRDNPSTKLSIEEFENNHGPSPHLDLILFKRIPRSTPVRSWDEADREARYQAVTQGWRDILSDETCSSDLRSNLALRMKLFQSCSSMTFLEDSNRMTKYWGKLFNGELDTFEKKINTLLAEFQRIAEEEEEVKKQKRWARYLRNQALRASMTEEQKREESQRRMIIRASKTQEEKKEQVRRNKINRHKFTGERKKRHQESLRRSIENAKQKMEQLKRTNFEKWKETVEEKRIRGLDIYNKMIKNEIPERRQKRLAKYKIYAKKTLLKKQVADGVITEEEMEVQFQEAKKRIEEETFSAPPKPYKERPRKKKLTETVTALTPFHLEKVAQPVNANPQRVIMLPASSSVILVDAKKLNQNYAPAAPGLIPEEEIVDQGTGTEELVNSPMSFEVKAMEPIEESISALLTESPPRSPLIGCFDDYDAAFDRDCNEIENNPSPELEVGNEIAPEIDSDVEKEIATSSASLVEPGLISTPDYSKNHAPESCPNSPVVEAVDGTNDYEDNDLLLNSNLTCEPIESNPKPEVPEQKCAQKKKQRVHKTRPRVKISCPKCGKKISTASLCYHYDRCGTNPETKRKRKPSSAPTAPSTEVLSCPQCSQWFSGKHILARHQYFAHGDGTNPDNHLRCHLCFKSFRQKATLDDHIRRVHEGKGFYCDLCPNRGDLQSAAKLWKHKVSFHGLDDLPPPSKVTVVQCEFCGETVLGRYFLHVKKNHPEMVTQMKPHLQCKSKSKKGLTKDPNSPHGKLKRCPQCSKLINTHWFSRHRKKVHGIGESLFCPECNREFKFKYELSVHIEKKHGIWEKFRQHNLVGKDPSKLNQHMCFLCLETFITKAKSQIHVIENHKEVYEYLTGSAEKDGEVKEKTFKCIKCLQDFEGGNSLAEHYKEEHNLKKRVRKRKGSNRSKNTRSVEENMCRCEDCGVKFETREDWVTHRHTEHNEEIEKTIAKINRVKAVTTRKTHATTKKQKQSLEMKLVNEVFTVRRSSRKITKRKFINEDSDSEDSGSERDSNAPRVYVKVEEDSLGKQMKNLKVILVRLTQEEIDQYRSNNQ